MAIACCISGDCIACWRAEFIPLICCCDDWPDRWDDCPGCWDDRPACCEDCPACPWRSCSSSCSRDCWSDARLCRAESQIGKLAGLATVKFLARLLRGTPGGCGGRGGPLIGKAGVGLHPRAAQRRLVQRLLLVFRLGRLLRPRLGIAGAGSFGFLRPWRVLLLGRNKLFALILGVRGIGKFRPPLHSPWAGFQEGLRLGQGGGRFLLQGLLLVFHLRQRAFRGGFRGVHGLRLLRFQIAELLLKRRHRLVQLVELALAEGRLLAKHFLRRRARASSAPLASSFRARWRALSRSATA